MARKTPDKDSYPKAKFAFVDNVLSINHRPHPYVIGTRHVAFAADNCGGILSDSSIRMAERRRIHCEHPGCRDSYDAHTSDYVAFVKLTRNCSAAEMQEWLKTCIPWCEEHGIDGFAFVDTGFRVQN